MKIKFLLLFPVLLAACNQTGIKENYEEADTRIPVIIDSDANNELDDQHALAYAFSNTDVFRIEGITVNNTLIGEGIEGHYREANRIARLFECDSVYPILKGAVGKYEEIVDKVGNPGFDGEEAVDFIIKKANEQREGKLILIPIGKLTNIALALKKDPGIIDKVKVVWLGSNYPDPGEYNLENDPGSVNPVIRSGVEFEMVLVAYGREDGTAAVYVPIKEIENRMPGLGPEVSTPVDGRNGGKFRNFGDYAVNLWKNMELYGELQSRSLFDLAAVAIVKNPDWCQSDTLSAPLLVDDKWISGMLPEQKIIIHRNFNRKAILDDFYKSLEKYELSAEE